MKAYLKQILNYVPPKAMSDISPNGFVKNGLNLTKQKGKCIKELFERFEDSFLKRSCSCFGNQALKVVVSVLEIATFLL